MQLLKNGWIKFRRRWLPYMYAYAAKSLIRVLLFTCRIKVHGVNILTETAEKHPCILMLWHDRIIILSEILQKHTQGLVFNALISKSRDGDPLAILARSYRRGRVIRVPHHSRHAALAKMIHHLKTTKEIILISPDGPRGPRHVIKPGIAKAAKETGAMVIPFSWKAERKWRLGTWDKMMIPKPFSTVNVYFGKPISFEKNSEKNLEEEMRILTDALRTAAA